VCLRVCWVNLHQTALKCVCSQAAASTAAASEESKDCATLLVLCQASLQHDHQTSAGA
jgi:hypothetical protein